LKLSDKILAPVRNPNWRETCILFFKLKPILKSDLKNGTNEIAHISADEFFGRKSQTDGSIMKFGKYKGKPKEWVKENDIGYYNWACENINGFIDRET